MATIWNVSLTARLVIIGVIWTFYEAIAYGRLASGHTFALPIALRASSSSHLLLRGPQVKLTTTISAEVKDSLLRARVLLRVSNTF